MHYPGLGSGSISESERALPLTHEAVDYFRESLPLRFPLGVVPNDRLMVAVNIYGYFDESGTQKGSRAFAIGGFLGRADHWGAFQFEWEQALADFDLPFFHMSSFESRLKGYDWPEEVRRERLSWLLGIIRRHVLGSVGVVLPLAAYNAVFREDEIPAGPNVEWIAPGVLGPGAPRPGDLPPLKPDMTSGALRRKTGGPYGLAATMLMMDVSMLVTPLAGDPHVAYIFEQGAEGRGQFLKVFNDNYDDIDLRRQGRLLSIAFEDKRRVVMLQAADILAYELYKHLPRQLGLEARPTRYTLHELAKVPYRWVTATEDELRKWHYVLGRGLHYSQGSWAR